MLYAILKLIYRLGLHVFFRRFEVRNRHLMPERGPLLVVSNHPNTFMDPIVTASLLRQPVYFIAKSTVFGSGLQNWLLRQMQLIPIHRREDNPNQAFSNKEAFKASYEALAQGKTLLIFPEGNSFNQRRLRQIKTGTARIALGAAAAQGLPVRILPVGLNYSAPTRFRSNVFVNVGEPIEVAQFLEQYHHDPQTTVQQLTTTIRERLETLIIHTPTDEEDSLARQIEHIYKERLVELVPAQVPEHVQDFLLTKAIIRALNFFSERAPQRVEIFKAELQSYLLQLKRLRLHDALLGKGHQTLLRRSMAGMLLLLLGLPLYLYGLLHNYIPYIIPSRVARALTREEEWFAPIMLTVGIFTFPAFYGLELWLAYKWLHLSQSNLLLYLLTLPLSGFFTLGYWDTVQHTHAHWNVVRLIFRRQHMLEKLRLQRQQLIGQLDEARKEYLQQMEANRT